MTTTDELNWTDAFLVGFPPMDDTHREFVDIVGAMLQADDDALLGHLSALIVHSEEHFAQEEAWMQKTGFPATECHTNEHAAVLTSMREVSAYLEGGGSPGEAR